MDLTGLKFTKVKPTKYFAEKYDLDKIAKDLAAGVSLEAIGAEYGVTRQRMYQVLVRAGLSTNIHKTKNKMRDADPRRKWLYRTLVAKGVTQPELDNIVFNIDLPDKCPVFGYPLVYGSGVARSKDSASIDRLNPGGPYELSNIHICSWRANLLKRDLTTDEILKMYLYLTKKKLSLDS